MAKQSKRARNLKQLKLVEKYRTKRADLKSKIKKETDPALVYDLVMQLAKLPVDSSAVRLNSRCQQCGRPHAVYQKFGLCRICLRSEVMSGNVTGARKSSW